MSEWTFIYILYLKRNKNLDGAITYSHIRYDMKNQPLYMNKNKTMTTAYHNWHMFVYH